MRAAIYSRVSTDEQAEHGYSLESQVEACKKYANDHGMDVIADIADDYSGSMLDRPGLDILRRMVDGKDVDAVVVYSSDRWSRKLAHSLILREELLYSGIELHFVSRGKVEDTPEANMQGNMLSVFDEYWKEKIIEGCKRGKDTKASKKRPVMSGYAPYGYRRSGKGPDAQLVIYEPEEQIVKYIFQWYVAGDGVNGPLSLRAISERLNGSGIETPRGGGKHFTDLWLPTTIRGILLNEIYYGTTFYGKSRNLKVFVEKKTITKRVRQPTNLWVEIPVPELALIGRPLFEAAQVRMKKNIELARRNQHHHYLLSGHFKCGSCGGAMAGGYINRYGVIYYRCGRPNLKNGREKCPYYGKSLPVQLVDQKVWEWLDGLIEDESKFKKGLERMAEQKAAEAEPQRARLNSIIALMDKVQHGIDRLVTNMREIEEEAVIATIKRELVDLGKQAKALDEERLQVESELYQQEMSIDMQNDLLRQAAEIRRKLENPTYEQKRILLDALNVKVIFREDDAGRWLDISCGLKPAGDVIALRSSKTKQCLP